MIFFATSTHNTANRLYLFVVQLVSTVASWKAKDG
jgi:hypothetical protein